MHTINIEAINKSIDDHFQHIDDANERLTLKLRFLRREAIRARTGNRKPHQRNNSKLNYVRNR